MGMGSLKFLRHRVVLPLVALAFMAGCGGGGGAPASTAVTASGTLPVAAGGTSPGAPTTLSSPAGTVLVLQADTVLTDGTGTVLPANPATPTSVTYSVSAADLPGAAVAAVPAGKQVRAFIDISIGTGATAVKNLAPPMSVTIPIPGAAVGSTVDVYSFSGGTGLWTLEQAGAVVSAGGTITFQVSHFSIYGGMTTVSGSTGSPGGSI